MSEWEIEFALSGLQGETVSVPEGRLCPGLSDTVVQTVQASRGELRGGGSQHPPCSMIVDAGGQPLAK